MHHINIDLLEEERILKGAVQLKKEAIESFEKAAYEASQEQRYEMLTKGSLMQRLAAIPYFETRHLVEVLNDPNPDVRVSALRQITFMDELDEVAKDAESIATLVNDPTLVVQKESLTTIQHFIEKLRLAADAGNTICENAYWKFIEAARTQAHNFTDPALSLQGALVVQVENDRQARLRSQKRAQEEREHMNR